MTATFKSNMQSDMDDVILDTTEFAETVSYTSSGESAKNISAVVNRRISGEIINTDTGLMKLWEYDIVVSSTDVASPSADDEYTIDSMSFDVYTPAEKTGEDIMITLRHFSDIESSEAGHRREISA